MSNSSTSCAIDRTDGVLRVQVGPGLPDEVQRCYHAIATECVKQACQHVLIIGSSRIDAFSHLALRDVLRAMALAGLPAGFRLAAVAETANLIAVYDAAVVEAGRLGIESRRFMTEEDALRWLAA